MPSNRHLTAVIILGVALGVWAFQMHSGQIKQLVSLHEGLDARISDNATMRDELASLGSYIAELEERLTGERSQLERQLANERNAREEQKTALGKQLELEKAQRELLAARSSADKLLAEGRIKELEAGVSELAKDAKTEVVTNWSPNVVRVECDFPETTTTGSGLLVKLNVNDDLKSRVVTNRHVVEKNGLTANSCKVVAPVYGTIAEAKASNKEILVNTSGHDVGFLSLNNVSEAIDILASRDLSICAGNANTGDDLLILGYPIVGSEEEVTVTDGIISGRDGNFYITSAKVERGNSGGAAIHVRDNCYLGIPTFVQAGNIESLARILDIAVLGVK